MRIKLITSTLFLILGSANAADKPNWNTAGLSLNLSDLETQELEGFGISGSKLMTNKVFITGSYNSVGTAVDTFVGTTLTSVDIDLNMLSMGVGYRHAVAPTTDLFGVLSYENIEAEASLGSFSDSDDNGGIGITVGVKAAVTSAIELTASAGIVEIDDLSESRTKISGKYQINNKFSVGAGYESYSELDTLSLSAHVNF